MHRKFEMPAGPYFCGWRLRRGKTGSTPPEPQTSAWITNIHAGLRVLDLVSDTFGASRKFRMRAVISEICLST